MNNPFNPNNEYLPKAKRNKKIVELKNKGLTYEDIGRMFANNGKPLSRQCIHQIYHRDKEKYSG